MSPSTSIQNGGYIVQTDDDSGIGIWGGSWQYETGIRGSSRLTAGIAVVGSNMIELCKRAIGSTILNFEALDQRDLKASDPSLYYQMHKASAKELSRTFNMQRIQSLSSVMERFSRDNKQMERGAFMYLCRTREMPQRVSAGDVIRQMPPSVTMGQLASKAQQMFFGAKTVKQGN